MNKKCIIRIDKNRNLFCEKYWKNTQKIFKF